MADKPTEEKPAEDDKKKDKVPLLKRLKEKRWICILVGTTVIAHFALIGVHAMIGKPEDLTGIEVPLGHYAYQGKGETARVSAAEFDLFISLLEELDRPARERLRKKQFKVEQDIEELLRRAHSADFEDPVLTELKRQIQETINSSLDVRAVSEVIITNLTIEARQKQPKDVQAPAGVSSLNDIPADSLVGAN